MSSHDADPQTLKRQGTLPVLVLRGSVGGALMGLANLVPGISGGTMLLAVGVYPAFIGSIAELTTLRFRTRSLVTLGTIGGSAALAILLLAGSMKALVIDERWLMYSLFIGLTLGGVPLVWRLARPATPAVFVGAGLAFGAMLLMLLTRTAGGDVAESHWALLFLSGLAGAAAMILPGVSGGYLLLLLGQYEPILGAIDQVKLGLLGGAGLGPDLAKVVDSLSVIVPVGIGVAVGVIGVSNLVKWLLDRYAKATLGVLLGLLFGAVVGLWPFQEGVPPLAGDRVDGQTLTAEQAREVDVEKWRVEFFRPSLGQMAASGGLLALGLLATVSIARLGDAESSAEE